MDLSGLAAVTTAAEMKAWLSANCLSPISPVMTGTDLGIIIQKIIDVTGEAPSFAFENGLTNNNGTVALGGTLTGDVVYNQGNYQTKFNFTDNALNDSFVAMGDGYVEIQTNGLTHNNSSARNLGVGTDVSISDGLMDFQVYNLTGSTYSGEFTLGVYGFANQPASSAWELMISNASGQKSFSSSLTVPFNEPSTAVNKGMIFKDSWDNMGLQYYNDYSAVGKTSPRWIPDWGAVTNAISASVGSATPAWSSITGKPTTLSGYGITDAYPLTGNPSGFLTSAVTGITAGSGLTGGTITTSGTVAIDYTQTPTWTGLHTFSSGLNTTGVKIDTNANIGIFNYKTIMSGAAGGSAYDASMSTQAASFTLATAYGYRAFGITIGAGSSVTNQMGYYVHSSMTTATNNYGFYGFIPAGTGRWNLYMNGTAANYLAGNTGIGTTSTTGKLNLGAGTATVAPLILTAGTNLTTPVSGSIENDGTSLYYTNSSNVRQALLTSSTAIAAANPTASIGLTAVNGSANTFMRSDAAPALSQAITPTWTGLHTFNAGLNVASGNVGIGTSNPAFKLDVQGGSASIYNNGAATGLTLGSNATGKTSIAIATSADASGYGYIQSISSFGTAFGNIAINPSGGNVGIGTASPQANLHIQGLGVSTNANSEYSYYGAIIQANTGSRSATIGAELEFVIPANTDGSNPWGQGRIITVAGSGNNGDATGKMILGTRRMFDKVGAGASWYYGDDITIDGHGYVGIGVTNPLAKFDIAAGTSAVASLRMGAGSLLTTPVSGSIENDGTSLYYTNSSNVRQALLTSSTATAAANPTASIGLTAVNGSAATYMRSDAAPAINQSITPYWQGLHNFNSGLQATGIGVGGAPVANSAINITGTVNSNGLGYGILLNTATSATVTNYYGIRSLPVIAANGPTSGVAVAQFAADQTVVGTGTTISQNIGFLASAAMTQGSQIVGFSGNIVAGANNYNLYMSGTAPNFLAGGLTVGYGSTNSSYIITNGPNSGSGSGGGMWVQNGGVNVIAMGNYSRLVGGAYDSTPTITGGTNNKGVLVYPALQLPIYNVVGLPALKAGLRAFAADLTSNTYGTVASGGGGNFGPVYCDGINWRVG